MQPNHTFHFLQNGIGQTSNLSVCQKTSPHLSITALAVLKQKSMGGNSSCRVVLKKKKTIVGRQLILVIRTMLLHRSIFFFYRYMIQLFIGLALLSRCSWSIKIGLYIFVIWSYIVFVQHSLCFLVSNKCGPPNWIT